jgi:hypothetical protein
MTGRPAAAPHVVVAHVSWQHLADVEHALDGVGADVGEGWVFTHEVRTPEPHYAVLACTSTPLGAGPLVALERRLGVRPAAPPAGDPAWAQLLAGDGPRAVRFPGQDALPDEPTVRALLAGTAIEALAVLGGGAIQNDDVVVTRGFLRPLLRGGRLVLPVLPAGAGRVAPFEVPDPTPCCGQRVNRPALSS